MVRATDGEMFDDEVHPNVPEGLTPAEMEPFLGWLATRPSFRQGEAPSHVTGSRIAQRESIAVTGGTWVKRHQIVPVTDMIVLWRSIGCPGGRRRPHPIYSPLYRKTAPRRTA